MGIYDHVLIRSKIMEIKYCFILFFLGLSLSLVTPATDADRLCMLEKKMDVLEPAGMSSGLGSSGSDRIAALERRMDALELLCVARAGMERHCLVPDVLNGKANCPKKMPPGSSCSVWCNTGYLPTPGKDTTECKDDGFWTREMECEIPLVIISGGLVDQGSGDSSVEVVSPYPSKGCDKKIAPMPLADGVNRTLHNMFYLPRSGRIIACNGLTDKHMASCDALSLKTNTWEQNNSYPNRGSKDDMRTCSTGHWVGYDCSDRHPYPEKGRYAAQGAIINGRPFIFGGMVYDKEGHDPVNNIRSLWERDDLGRGEDYWRGPFLTRRRMGKPRAFFCTAEVENGLLMIGGLSREKKSSVVEKSVQYSIGGSDEDSKFLADMTIPRSGHGCAAVAGNNSVLVSGGTQGFGESAVSDAEVFSWSSNSWRKIASMNVARFGHAVISIGKRIFAIGGDDRKNNYMDTIEEYDAKKNNWKIMSKKLKKARSSFGFTVVPHSIFDGCVIDKPLNE